MTSVVDTSVKVFSSDMPGAPVLSGTVGAMVAILDAVLVDGFGLKSVDSLSVTAGVATASISTGHSAKVGTVVQIAGSSISALNGEQRVVSVTTNTVSFETTAPNGTATGTITLKIAGAGWTKAFEDTNKRAYKSSSILSTGFCLRIDDTNARYARARGYESMTDVDTGTGLFPKDSQVNGGYFWSKSNADDSNAREWILIASDRTFHFFRKNTNTYETYESSSFGDYKSYKVGDAHNCMIHGYTTDGSGSNMGTEHLFRSSYDVTAYLVIARPYHTLGGSTRTNRVIPSLTAQNNYYSGGGGSSGYPFPKYPSPVDGSLFTSPIFLSEEQSLVVHGHVSGVYGVPMDVPAGSFLTKDVVSGSSNLAGKKLFAVGVGVNSSNAGFGLIDITGPWEY